MHLPRSLHRRVQRHPGGSAMRLPPCKFRRSALWVSLLVLGILACSVHRTFVLADAGVVAENGFLENCQAAVLLLCALIGLHAAATGHAADRSLLLLLAWTCIGMALRELDLERLQAVPPWLARLASGRSRTLLLAGGLLALGTFGAMQWRRRGRAMFGLLQPRPLLLLALAYVLLLIGRRFELQSALVHHVLLEEAAELLAYGLLLQVGLQWWLGTRQRSQIVHTRGVGIAGNGGRSHSSRRASDGSVPMAEDGPRRQV